MSKNCDLIIKNILRHFRYFGSYINQDESKVIDCLCNNTSVSEFMAVGCTFEKNTTLDLINMLSINEYISTLILRNNCIKPQLLVKLCNAIGKKSNIKKLDIVHDGVNKKIIGTLAKILMINKTLLNLSIGQSSNINININPILESLHYNTTLHTLSVLSNTLDKDNCDCLITMLKTNKTVQCLELYIYQLSDELLQSLINILTMETFLTKISINHWDCGGIYIRNVKEIDDRFIKNISAALNNTNIKKLSIKKGTLTRIGAKYLADALLTNKSLTSINLFRNRIGSNGVKYLANLLQINKSLTRVNLSCNTIDNNGAKYLADLLLTNNTSLKKLDLSINNIKNEGVQNLSEALKCNTTLESLYLNNNGISEGVQNLAEALKCNTTLKSLYLNNNQISCKDALVLADALKVNNTLVNLRLNWNKIGIDGLLALCKSSVKSLDVLGNDVNFAENYKILADVLSTNTSLTRIKLCEGYNTERRWDEFIKLLDKNYTIVDFGDITYDSVCEYIKRNKQYSEKTSLMDPIIQEN